MKKLALAVLVISCVTCKTNLFAQLPAPVAGAHRPLVNAAGPAGPGLRAVTTMQGKVVKLQANDDFTFDGFFLLNGGDSILVKFPAHMGSQLMPLVKPGSQVSVSGVLENPLFGGREMRMVSLTGGNKTLSDTPPAITPPTVQETAISGNGKVSALQKDPQGFTTGLFLDNKTILRLPPHVSGPLGNSLAKGSAIAYTGIQKPKGEGEMMLEDYQVIHCSTITVNGQQYLVR